MYLPCVFVIIYQTFVINQYPPWNTSSVYLSHVLSGTLSHVCHMYVTCMWHICMSVSCFICVLVALLLCRPVCWSSFPTLAQSRAPMPLNWGTVHLLLLLNSKWRARCCIVCLTLFSSRTRTHRDSLNKMIAAQFPLRSSEFAAGSSWYHEYIGAINKVLMHTSAAERSVYIY